MNIDELKVENFTDIRCKEYIHTLKKWKKGKLVTIDGWGQYSSLEITEKNKIHIQPLVKFPKRQLSTGVTTFPEVNVIYSGADWLVHYFSDIESNMNIDYMPVFTKVCYSRSIFRLKDKIFLLPYSSSLIDFERYDYFIYDLEHDKTIYDPFKEKSDFFKDSILYSFKNGKVICQSRDKDNLELYLPLYYIYDFETKEKITNEITDYISIGDCDIYLEYEKENELLVYSKASKLYNIIKWSNGFEDIKIENLISPTIDMNNKNLSLNSFSSDMKWGCGEIFYYAGINNEELSRLFFINLEKKMVVVTEEYYEKFPYKANFIEHPLYGMCFVFEVTINDKTYIRIYKMSDVEQIIEIYIKLQAKNILK